MNSDQLRNIQEYCDNIGEVITKCRVYIHVLRGLHLGRVENPESSEAYGVAIDAMYRSTWEALFAAFGTLIDSTKSTYSLHMLITKVQRYAAQDHPIKKTVIGIRKELQDPKNRAFVSMKLWRMKFVAHHTREARSEGFHSENKIHFDEVETAVGHMEEMVNKISQELLNARYTFRLPDSAEIENQLKRLFAAM